MDSKHKRLRPKLDRRNAIKNIDYDASISSPSPSPSSSFDESARRSRSLEIYRKQTSFRIKGIGDFDVICRDLGLSGPDDFAIPAAAWEAQKALSSSRLRSVTTSAKPDSVAVDDDISAQFQARITLSRFSKHDNPSNLAGFESRVKVGTVEAVGPSSTIKGVRPPVLAPPPVMLRPLVDNVSSSWDILKSFAPQDDSVLNSHINMSSPSASSSSSDGEKNRVVEENEELVGETEREVRLGETDHPLESSSSSFRSNHNDDDVFYTSREITVYSFSPSGSFMRSISSWQKGELLGSGSFGTVYEGFTEDGYFFAVKEVSLLDQGSLGKQSVLQLEQEISLLSQFQHENIVQYLGTSKDESKLYIFLELITKGSLASLYHKYRLRDSQVSVYTRQILNGLIYLHDQNVVHRDIKCANILVDASGSVKLADFGLAKATKMNDVKSSRGTPFWMAPEVVNLRNRGYGLAADIWSLGCTVLEMLTRRPPYSHLEGMQALFMIGKGNPPPVPDCLSSDARDFILKCIQVNPNDRPSAAQLLDHPFVRRPLQSSFGPPSPYYNGTQS